MRGKDISDALGLLPDAVIQETDAVRKREKGVRDKTRWMAAAACLALAIGLGASCWQFLGRGSGELPMLTVGREWNTGGMGMFACFEAYDFSEIVDGDPWNEEMEISKLPVFKTPLDSLEEYPRGDFARMEEVLRDVADRLGLDGETLEVKKDIGTCSTPLVAQQGGVNIEVSQDLCVVIHFEPAVEIPEKYSFGYNSSYEELEEVAKYLIKEYNALMGMEEPKASIEGGDYDIFGKQHYILQFYDGSGDDIQQMISYNFNRVEFASHKNKLWLIRIEHPDLSKLVGNYPIISAKEAKERLLNGDYLSSVPYEAAGREYVKGVKLGYLYKPDIWEECGIPYYLPYYTFYVELPEEEGEDGRKAYGIYYVPAVEGKYLSPPQREVRFN